MADSTIQSATDDVIESIDSLVPEVLKNVTIGRAAASTEGICLAYLSLFLMAVVPIFWGSFRSITYHRKSKENGEEIEMMSTRDVYMFPIMASSMLFGIYLVVKYLSAGHLNMVIATYFFVIGTFALTGILRQVIGYFPGTSLLVDEELYHIRFNKGEKVYLECKFDVLHIVALVLSALFGVWYLAKKHWLANNVFGLAFSVSGVEMISLGSVKNGCILLSLLFFYDIFWVFGTEVMVEVAKNLDAPIKVVFPMDFLESGVFGKNMAMLGLGDIVLPGVFIALLIRYDLSKGEGSHFYFFAGFAAYILGLGVTMGILTIFNAAQPALLYLVPSCVGIPLLLSLVKGEFKSLFEYSEEKTEETKNEKEE